MVVHASFLVMCCFYRTQVRSLPCLVTESLLLLRLYLCDPCMWRCWVHAYPLLANVESNCWICQSCYIDFFWSSYMDLSKLMYGFLLSCYMDLSKLLHGFVKVVTWICLSCYIDLLELLNGCQKKLSWSSPFAKQNRDEVRTS